MLDGAQVRMPGDRYGLPRHAFITRDDIPKLHPVHVFDQEWRLNRDPSGYYLRKNFEPGRFPTVIPWFVIFDYDPEPPGGDFVYRLCGTGFNYLAQDDYTGGRFSEHNTHKSRDLIIEQLAAAAETNQPQFAASPMPLKGRDFMMIYRGVFPVSVSGERVDQLFAVVAEQDYEVSLQWQNYSRFFE